MTVEFVVRASKNVWSWGNYFDAFKMSTSVILKITVENKFQFQKRTMLFSIIQNFNVVGQLVLVILMV